MFLAGTTFLLVVSMGHNRLPSSLKWIAAVSTPCFKLRLDKLSRVITIINEHGQDCKSCGICSVVPASSRQVSGWLMLDVHRVDISLVLKATEAAAQEGGSSSSKPSGPLSHANGGVNHMEGVEMCRLAKQVEKKNQNEEDVLRTSLNLWCWRS